MANGPDGGNFSTEIQVAKIGLIGALVVAVCGLIGTFITVFGTAISTYFSSQAARAPLVLSLNATQTAEAKALKFGASPSTPVMTSTPSFLLRNKLVRPVRVFVGDAYAGYVEAESDESFPLEHSPALVKWEIVKETTQEGKTIGDDMAGNFDQVRAGQTIEVIYIANGQEYFYPMVTNHTSQNCEVTINKGWEHENIPGAFVSPNTEDSGLGYYKLFTNSNISLDCGGSIAWWGKLPGSETEKPFYKDVNPVNGTVHFTVEP